MVLVVAKDINNNYYINLILKHYRFKLLRSNGIWKSTEIDKYYDFGFKRIYDENENFDILKEALDKLNIEFSKVLNELIIRNIIT